ncbi:hypothetical protein [Mesorhizobium sp. BR-1-1-10]|uniref:hypothetical protein n=1 Tax=Mesorhizobium sp. BR-1-1-10 TaxID=2876660 RepID=UPI001CD15E31|nr:hypothetical protein [Mesorhizobium sp. BR-1-1-10]MBZ9979204.1 hypothetical protein [Mesorhizobium sp. BR-1-1-10]
MKRFLLAILVGLTLLTADAAASVDPRISARQSALIQCNLLWSAKLSAQPGNPQLLARKAQQLCASQDAAYERVIRSVLPYKEIADRHMRKAHASQLKSNASMIVKVRAIMKQ